MDITFERIIAEPLLYRELMAIEDIFMEVQRVLGVKTSTKKPGILEVLSSPIEWFGSYGVSSHQSYPTCTTISKYTYIDFLTDSCQSHLLHTSGVIRIFEIESDGSIILNTRYCGVAEPSIYGMTKKFDYNVKLGYIKIQEKVDVSGELTLRNWNETKIVGEKVYEELEIEKLYYAFPGNNSNLSLDNKWKVIVQKTKNLIMKRSYFSQKEINTSMFLSVLDYTIFFSEDHNYCYGILNNCQTFLKNFYEFASRGHSDSNKSYAKYMRRIFRLA